MGHYRLSSYFCAICLTEQRGGFPICCDFDVIFDVERAAAAKGELIYIFQGS